jgi:2-dehydro-3-deoxy-D-arabinonate dehydratase
MRAVTDGGDGAGTRETPRDVPEADLPRVVIAHREIVGYTISNDVSSPSIEGENPWHLSRAKIYMASYDLAPEVRPVCDIADPLPLLICVENGPELREAWEAAVSTVQLHRKLDDPVDWLFAQQEGPDGVVPSASICLARPIETTLPPGDLVCIRIDDVGELSNYMGIPLTAAS